ncbi:MAG TPA: zf-HC2 domain-containing protein, partial [Kofleriaceae bacterium]|nr:zf-HC2 domain-containing protein [Kofleriaceae bacterium]
MTSSHVSALQLDALALDALDGDAAARVRAHLVSCAQCRSDQEAAAELRAQFSRSVLLRTLPVRRPRRWLWLAVPALAALGVILALWPRQPPVPEIAIKGDASWEVFANRDGRVFAVHDGSRLGAGDRIRFAIVPAGARYLLVASVDGGGAVTIYYPYN